MRLHGSRAVGAFVPLCWLFTIAPAAGDTAPIWNGAYAGVHGGVTWAELNPNWDNIGLGDFGDVITRDGIWGLHGGYNFAKGRIIFGVEADVNFGGANFEASAFGFRASAEANWSGSIRARFGMTAGPMLIYGTAGYAYLDADISSPIAIDGLFNFSESLDGLVYGAGVEGFVMPNMSLRVEALRYEYALDHETLREFFDPSETVLRAGMTYHFN